MVAFVRSCSGCMEWKRASGILGTKTSYLVGRMYLVSFYRVGV